MIYIKAVYGQILTVVANILVLCLINSFAMLLTPFSTKFAFLTHLVNQPLLEQIRMGFTGFTKKRYMIGQDGRRPILSMLSMSLLAVIGLVFFFISTIVYQTSDTKLMRTPSLLPPDLIIDENIPKVSNGITTYPTIEDKYLGAQTGNENIQPGKQWLEKTKYFVSSESQWNGEASVFLNDLNWMQIESNGIDFKTTVSMSIDGISVEELSSTSPGTVNIQVLDKGSPALFDVPSVSTAMGQAYAFAVEGKNTLDYLNFELVAFDSQKWTNDDNLMQYYSYVDAHTNKTGKLLLNNTYDYSNNKPWDKDSLQGDLESAENEVKYSMISVQNQTAEEDNFQTYFLSKRSVRRQDKIKTQNGTIELLEYDYIVRITRYEKTSLNDNYKVKYNNGNGGEGVLIPVTPVFRTSQPAYINLASLIGSKRLIADYVLETYIDILPLIVLICVYGGLTLIFTLFAYAYNFRRIRNKAYSVPLETLNFLLYSPGNALMPLFQKVNHAEFSMVDGFDPSTGYNHLGLVPPEDADRISRREPDVPYGLVYKTPQGMLDASPYSGAHYA